MAKIKQVVRACPNCAIDADGEQREVNEEQFGKISLSARRAVFASTGRCFVCGRCGHVYIRQAAARSPLGFLEEDQWRSELFP